MRRWLILTLFLICFAPVLANNSSSREEEFYLVKFGPLLVAEVSTIKQWLPEQNLWQLSANLELRGCASVFGDDIFCEMSSFATPDSFFTREMHLCLKFFGPRQVFDVYISEDTKALFRSKRDGVLAESLAVIPFGSRDFLAIFWRLKDMDPNYFYTGQTVYVDVIKENSQTAFRLKTVVLKQEKIILYGQELDCWVIEPKLGETGLFDMKGRLMIWVANNGLIPKVIQGPFTVIIKR